jgi:hypothetical protein
MYVKKRIEELGIKIISKLDDRTVCDLANKIAILLVDTFSNYNLDYLKIVDSLQHIQMYIAEIPKGIAPVDYFYKDNVMYISDTIEISPANEFILHESIHRIQEFKNKKEQLVQLGICNISETKIQGMALNEAAVQYIVSKLLKRQVQVVEIYDMKIPTISKNYYPIITNLIQQLAFVLDEELLIKSVLNSNDEFKYNAIDTLGEERFFLIQANFDKILKNKDCILENKIANKDISQNVEQIKTLYIETQKLILISYFDNMINRLETIEEVNIYKSKLIQYKDLIGSSEGLEFYINYYMNKIKQIKIIEQNIESKKKRSLTVVSDNKIFKILKKIKNYLLNSFSNIA